ncbi:MULTISPECIES: MGMT family protein [Paenibacillus]|uniref:DNA methyltransferase n=1 Tax=Paenibacillus campinasensis TaxID=66347 RepID=A0A268EY39_9BACL|nr:MULTISPECIES: MGMT family protein [Paenibacillus]MUG66563.1 methylated-DNA--[protein]-cysteine S-methyltransferase [Paenibacillus campinasensis]PAD78027.1 DNA methyltransferase [Paenibacillus campinasensis]PAK52891.1 DNA methyltransferase [Paenibacillus sp. 7541]
MQPFTRRVIEIIKAIPEGSVMTYGQIARQAGSPRAARQVVRILHSMSRAHQLPWHRVVNAKGEIALQEPESKLMQELFLREEGIELTADGRIDLGKYRHEPGFDDP